MAGEWLLDTGPIVAVLDRSEKTHSICVAAVDEVRGPLLTTEAVLTEATHLLADQPGGAAACVEFLLGIRAVLVPMDESMLRRTALLMRKYRNIPMDFADATLVVLAEQFGINKVLTLDRRGFGVYRIDGRRPFQVQP